MSTGTVDITGEESIMKVMTMMADESFPRLIGGHVDKQCRIKGLLTLLAPLSQGYRVIAILTADTNQQPVNTTHFVFSLQRGEKETREHRFVCGQAYEGRRPK